MDCIFCSIVAGAASAWRVHEDDDTVAFLDIGQATAGHTLVVPKAARGRHLGALG